MARSLPQPKHPPRAPATRTTCAAIAVLVAVVLAASALSAAAATTLQLDPPPAPISIAVENPPLFPLKNVRIGQRGHGFTVYRTALGPERFEFEVLGIMRGALGPGEDLIIAQLIGDKIERTGVISGMSGSPAYIDGKLVGAVGYRFGSFTKDAIAGITPIERMLEVKDAPSRPARKTAMAHSRFGAPVPIATPLVVSGIRPDVLDAFSEQLSDRGYEVVPAAGSSGADPARGRGKRFFASGPIAGNIVSGDINMSGIGTVTWVHGNRFLAFGHAFQGLGVTAMPVSNAEIVITVAADSGSWKMGQATTPVGALTDDRLHAIAGTMGQTVPTVSVDFDLDIEGPRKASDAKNHVHIEVMKSKSETGLMTAIALSNALGSRINVEEGGTIDLTGTAWLDDGTKAELRSRVAFKAGTAAYLITAIGLLGELSELTDSGLKHVELEKIAIRVTRSAEVREAKILTVAPRGRLSPGTTAKIDVRAVDHGGHLTTRTMTVPLPRGLPEGKYALIVASPGRAVSVEDDAGLLPRALTFEQLMTRRKKKPPVGSMTAYLVRDKVRPRIEGGSLAKVPAALAGVLEDAGGNALGKTDLYGVRLGRIVIDAAISGGAKTTVVVEAQRER